MNTPQAIHRCHQGSTKRTSYFIHVPMLFWSVANIIVKKHSTCRLSHREGREYCVDRSILMCSQQRCNMKCYKYYYYSTAPNQFCTCATSISGTYLATSSTPWARVRMHFCSPSRVIAGVMCPELFPCTLSCALLMSILFCVYVITCNTLWVPQWMNEWMYS